MSDARHTWDEIAAAWRRERPQSLWRRHSDWIHERLLERWLPPAGGKALKTDLFDEAFGGGLCRALRSRGFKVTGVDISPRVCQVAREADAELLAVTADVRRLPFADDSFDVILSNSTLDHFDSEADIAAALDELARLLKPGGTLVITMDNPSNPVVSLRALLPERLLMAAGILKYPVGVTCGAARLRTLLASRGLAAQESMAIMHCPRVLAIPIAGLLGERLGSRFLAALRVFERLEDWPTRFLTGHFVAVRALKTDSFALKARSDGA